eukprot:scaffold2100_cov318-Pavlova_lutheri.AAC.6
MDRKDRLSFGPSSNPGIDPALDRGSGRAPRVGFPSPRLCLRERRGQWVGVLGRGPSRQIGFVNFNRTVGNIPA